MSLVSDFDSREKNLIEQMVSVHLYTKKYLLVAEEVAEQGELFLQPLKEHRDAFDHLMRCYSIYVIENNLDDEKKADYVAKNLDKAFGHVYRAFFDTADWLTYILRKWIRCKLIEAGNEICMQKFDDYDKIKKLINDVPIKVAKLRESKDVAKSDDKEDNIIKEIKEYVTLLDDLIDLRKRICVVLGL